MKLVTKEIMRKIPQLYSQEGEASAMAVVKFFAPCGSWTWYASEGDAIISGPSESKGDGRSPLKDALDQGLEIKDILFFGYVDGTFGEYGYFRLSYLEAQEGPMGLKIERDLYWTPRKMRDIDYEVSNRAHGVV